MHFFARSKTLSSPGRWSAVPGDTPASVRNRQKKRLPTALITTPESLCLLLSYPGAQEQFGSLRSVVVDEWHELMGSKRGVLMELAVARLKMEPGPENLGTVRHPGQHRNGHAGAFGTGP